MKILLYISQFSSPGGAEKVTALMANHWAEKHEVTLLSSTPINEDFFELKQQVNRKVFGLNMSTKYTFIKLKVYISGVFRLRKMIKKIEPDIIISHIDMSNILMLLAIRGLNIPIIVEDHNNPEMKPLSQPWKFLKSVTYAYADKIILLIPALLSYYEKKFHNKITYIANPLNISTEINDIAEVKLVKPTFIAVGSLTKQKGLNYLLDAFALVQKEKPDWNLTILGEGVLRKELVEYATSLKILDKVHLPGRVSNPYAILKDADIYVMSSRFEGFPVALCEAMGVGLPCISFDCPTGPSDIINHGSNGLLVEYLNSEALAKAMILLSNNQPMRETLAKEASKINDTLHIDKIMSQWDDVILEVLKECLNKEKI